MKRMRLVCALFVASIALGQPAGRGTMSGTVVEAPGTTPVRKAIVTLTLETTPRTWATARTDDLGRFRFTGLPPGRYRLRADKQGVGSAIYGADSTRGSAEVIPLNDGQTREGLTLHFLRSSEISGHVYGTEGDVVTDADIELSRVSRNLGERVLVNFRNVATDDRGEYRMTGLPPGQYYLRASPKEFVMAGNSTQDLAAQYYGGVRDWRDSAALTIHSSTSLHELDFHLTAERHYPVHGRLTGVPNLPAPAQAGQQHGPPQEQGQAVTVTIWPVGPGPGGWSSGTEAQPPDYTFDLGIPPGGNYFVEAQLSVGDKTYSASRNIDSSQPLGEIQLALAPSEDLKGRLRIEGERPARAAATQITLIRRSGKSPLPMAVPNADGSGADGSFVLRQVPAGEWTLAVAPLPVGGYLKSARLGGRDVRFSRFHVEQGSLDRASLEIVISMHSATVTGQVDAAEGVSKRAGIVLAPVGELHNLARFYYGAGADEDGKFQLQNIAPGRYKVFALEKLVPADFRNPEAVDQLEGLGQEIELTEGGTFTAHPKLIPTARARQALPEEGQKP